MKKKLEELKKLPPPPKVDLDSINQKISALQALIKDKKSAIDMNNKNIAELQKLHDEFAENTISNFYLPFAIAPNFIINKKLYT